MKKEVGTFNTDLVPSFLCVHVCVCVCTCFQPYSSRRCTASVEKVKGLVEAQRLDAGGLFFFFNSSTQFGPEQV